MNVLIEQFVTVADCSIRVTQSCKFIPQIHTAVCWCQTHSNPIIVAKSLIYMTALLEYFKLVTA